MALAQHLPADKRTTCAYAKTLLMLTPDDRATLEKWMAGDVPGAHIAKALRDNNTGYVGESVIREHRRRACACTR